MVSKIIGCKSSRSVPYFAFGAGGDWDIAIGNALVASDTKGEARDSTRPLADDDVEKSSVARVLIQSIISHFNIRGNRHIAIGIAPVASERCEQERRRILQSK